VPADRSILAGLTLPYDEYTDEDVRERHLYVEASRGCPFKCEFCLSALDKTAWPFPNCPGFLQELESLHGSAERASSSFVDRTFNLKAIPHSRRCLSSSSPSIEAEPDDPVFRTSSWCPIICRTRCARHRALPEGCLQFEIGIQTWNPTVQALISAAGRRTTVAADNLRWLLQRNARRTCTWT
jgi:hypothetical protein